MIFWWAMATLMTYRVSYLIVKEVGPFGLMEKLRSLIYWRWGPGTLVYRGINCPYCVSWWVAWAAAAFLPWQTWVEYVLLAQGVAGAVAVMYGVLEGKS